MNANKLLLALACLLFSAVSYSQEIRGRVMHKTAIGLVPAAGASIIIKGTHYSSICDDSGYFLLPGMAPPLWLEVSYLDVAAGDSVRVEVADPLIVLESAASTGVRVTASRMIGQGISAREIRTVEQFGEREFKKAACCNLSEAFENNGSVQTQGMDALTGYRQLEMLGLPGKYIQINRENMPYARGILQNQAVTFLPSAWVKAVNISKGSGAVANGAEGMAGSIDIRLKQPDGFKNEFEAGAYSNQIGRSELNLFGTRFFGRENRWSAAGYGHISTPGRPGDMNHDHFYDGPRGEQMNGMGRIFYSGPGGDMQLSVHRVEDRRWGGQHGFLPKQLTEVPGPFGFENHVKRTEVFGKAGWVFGEEGERSLGSMWSYTEQRNHQLTQTRELKSAQRSFYGNVLYDAAWAEATRILRLGANMQYDDVDEDLTNRWNRLAQSARREWVNALYSEFTWRPTEKLDLIGGLRGEYSNLFGWGFLPRLHGRYSFSDDHRLRFSVGKGYRVPYGLSDISSWWISSRGVASEPGQPSPAAFVNFAARREISWNAGGSYTADFRYRYRPASLTVDYYYTWFTRVLSNDRDQRPDMVHLYFIDGKPASVHAVQATLDIQPVRRMELRLMGRMLSSEIRLVKGNLSWPMVPRFNGLMSLTQRTRKSGWSFTFTAQLFGPKRLPATQSNPENFRMPEESPVYVNLLAHVEKKLGKQWELYAGGENLGNYMQHLLILGASDPYGPYFDAAMNWGPNLGRMIYAGVRYKVISK